MFRTSLLCYLWSELTEIRFFLKLIMYFNKKTCKSEFRIFTPIRSLFADRVTYNYDMVCLIYQNTVETCLIKVKWTNNFFLK